MSETQNVKNRWLIAIMGTTLQLCLGTVYAWSYFQKLMVDKYSWSNVSVAWIFCLAICFLGLSAAVGGMILPKVGPRKLAMTGGFLFGAGYLIAALAIKMESLPLLYLGYGVIGGSGLGFGYVTPVATVAKWFPDKKGFATGMVVMGFGLGALLMSKVLAPLFMERLTDKDMVMTFLYLGGVFLVVAMTAGSFLVNPPAGYLPKGYTPPAPAAGASSQNKPADRTVAQCVCSGQFMMMWLIFFCNITAGIAIIGFQSPMLQTLWAKFDVAVTPDQLRDYGATLIAITALFNGLGRFFWGGVSDKIGRLQTFRVLLATQIIVFIALVKIENPWIFGLLLCYVLLCYGGGFGTMPSYVLDTFGSKLMAVVYGIILTAWSMAGIVGPQITAYITDNYGPSVFYSESFKDSGKFILKLKNATKEADPISFAIKEKFSAEFKQQLDAFKEGSVSPELFQALANELNALIKKPLYDKDLFATVTLSKDAAKMTEKKLQGLDLMKLNRLLLETVYPSEVEKGKDRASTYSFIVGAGFLTFGLLISLLFLRKEKVAA